MKHFAIWDTEAKATAIAGSFAERRHAEELIARHASASNDPAAVRKRLAVIEVPAKRELAA